MAKETPDIQDSDEPTVKTEAEAAAIIYDTEDETPEAVASRAAEAKTTEEAEAAAAVEKDDENEDGKSEVKDSKADETEHAPEEYTEFSVPEDMNLDEAAVEAFAPIAKELDLTQDQAQKLVDIYAERKLDETRGMHDAFETVQADWQKEAKADKEYGGDNFTANIKLANNFLTEYGSADLNTALAETGMGNHPELIRLFVKAGKVMGDDTLDFGKGQSAVPQDPADILFPNQGK